ncbi:hypothetical protein SHKM778_03650 [Streptomyces sp. KM77-8]|uniref:Uncharacterized protein n=1 Tax=Streptomyces haneummycinicus TaxID=3074435 RepID=A0AAT9H9A8_9ACTN
MAFCSTPAVSFIEAATFCGPRPFFAFFAKTMPMSARTSAISTFAAKDSRKQSARFQWLQVRMP